MTNLEKYFSNRLRQRNFNFNLIESILIGDDSVFVRVHRGFELVEVVFTETDILNPDTDLIKREF